MTRPASAAFVALLVGVTAACNHSKPPTPPLPITYTAGFSSGSDGYKEGCGYTAFHVWQGGELGAGIFMILPQPYPSPPPGYKIDQPTGVPKGLTWIPDGPAEGASLSGNFDGFGKRWIKDASSNDSYLVDVVYHTTDYDAVLNRMRQVDCFE